MEDAAAAKRRTPEFGISLIPSVRDIPLAFTLARIADETKLDFISLQDHPYNGTFLDTWTQLSVLAARTERVRVVPNVANLPLRPPAMLAKAAASLDLLTGGRVEMALGAGAFWEGIAAYGGPRRAPGEAVAALEEAMQVMRALWQPPQSGQGVSFAGKYYRLDGAQPGQAPAHPISIWLGAIGPRMLRLTGRLADGWLPSSSYVPPSEVPALQDIIDEAARQAERPLSVIRRAYNVAGVIQRPGDPMMSARRQGLIIGPVERWAEALMRYYYELRMDTFIFWPAGHDEERQIRIFAEEVAPAVRAAISAQR